MSIGRRDDKRTWRIDFKDTATDAEKAAAQAALTAFDNAAEAAKDVAKRARAALVETMMRELAERMADDPALLDRIAPRRGVVS